jgi:lipoprotein-anchoring transpeptidase ErfK/SrfK
MGIYGGAGFHGTADVGSIGSAASHGCVRMQIPDIIDLYERVSVGTPVFVN